ncbi:MAG: type II toxin-antitoxin system ParD family antitoxin [Planctomycetes bacterium]|nr:type II toxin-antitoxin system ParD family antitoxin [Planctomycetota bacterium]
MSSAFSSDIDQLVQQQLATGQYQSAEDVMRTALQLLADRSQRLKELRAEVQVGRDDLARGDYEEYDESSLRELFDGIQQRGRARYEARNRS